MNEVRITFDDGLNKTTVGFKDSKNLGIFLNSILSQTEQRDKFSLHFVSNALACVKEFGNKPNG